MKPYLILFCCLIFISCNQNAAELENRVAQLETQINEAKPGLGEIMGVIQQHHAKLSYAGNAQNWPLAAFELDEIKEGLEKAAKNYPRFKDVKARLDQLVKMMNESVEAVASAIQAKNTVAFQRGFTAMTLTCNQCHEGAERAFIVIKTPVAVEFDNQRFNKE